MSIGVSFPTFAYKDLKRPIPPNLRILGLDPGETTGWAFFEGAAYCGQGEIGPHRTVESAAFVIDKLIDEKQPHVIVNESYRVYAWRANAHTHSDLFTPRLIGAVGLLAAQKGIKRFEQSAHQAKAFVTDAKLKEWEFYVRGQRHSRDAVRHVVYYLLFGKLPKPIARLQQTE